MRFLLPHVVGAIYLGAVGLGFAQVTNAPAPAAPPPAAASNPMVSFLSPAQQQQYAAARAKALTDNPGLKEEGDALIKQGAVIMNSGSPADRQGFMDMMTSHREKLRAAMLKEDPTLRPVFDEIDNHISELRARGLPAKSDQPPTAKSPAPAN